MSCCGRCPCSIEATDCMDVDGDGSTTNPYAVSPILPATIEHTILPGIDVSNGIACGADGLSAMPYGFTLGGEDDIGVGLLPPIIADTAAGIFPGGPLGSIPWGPALSVPIPNPSPDGLAFTYQFILAHPVLTVELEPGAEFTYGFNIACPDPLTVVGFALFVERVVNNSAVLMEFSTKPAAHVDIALLAAGGSTNLCAVSTVSLSGSSGGSSITSAVFGSGMSASVLGGTT